MLLQRMPSSLYRDLYNWAPICYGSH
jgi:hypothetical protein